MFQGAGKRVLRASLGILVAGGIVQAIGFAGAALLFASDALPGDVLAAIGSARQSAQLDLIFICPPPLDVPVGIRVGLLAVLFGSVPAAALGAALGEQCQSETAWSEDWGKVFRAGFVFQSGSLVFTAFLLALLILAAYFEGPSAQEVVAAVPYVGCGGGLSVLCGVWAPHRCQPAQAESSV
jgi:hypothetical protein